MDEQVVLVAQLFLPLFLFSRAADFNVTLGMGAGISEEILQEYM